VACASANALRPTASINVTGDSANGQAASIEAGADAGASDAGASDAQAGVSAVAGGPKNEVIAPAPNPVVVDTALLLVELRKDFPDATLDPSTPENIVRVAFGKSPGIVDVRAFSEAFFEQHGATLRVGTVRQRYYPPSRGGQDPGVLDGGTGEHAPFVRQFSSIPRDSGCSFVHLTLFFDSQRPTSLERTCERLTVSPPSYASRALPSTAMKEVDILGYYGESHVVDKFGDLYKTRWRSATLEGDQSEYVLYIYVKTLPTKDVERFARDVTLARSSRKVEFTAFDYNPVSNGYDSSGEVDLLRRAGAAADRANRWLYEIAPFHQEHAIALAKEIEEARAAARERKKARLLREAQAAGRLDAGTP
jgi:hypothetical protein